MAEHSEEKLCEFVRNLLLKFCQLEIHELLHSHHVDVIVNSKADVKDREMDIYIFVKGG